MSLVPCNIIHVPDITAKARNIALESGLSAVVWDTCHLVWDSCDLLEDAPAKQDQMAVFGARGQIESSSEQRHAFLIRYIVDFETGLPVACGIDGATRWER
ncbi:uncharacterized protein N7459_004650 [Penicillium hispanicum]|uniref:uncharacterized protein n=1 Tax=Penicillium hispanicum TaxID=1080232 RepID=UPI00253FA2AA|nr:uncharacterized protein N7459_004650 [Penicillium hispanicum]KAJ5584850.1 hypothetical protein N7459_004650 [Penicillium hispanicum]